jgi:Tol biopolymer transport system component
MVGLQLVAGAIRQRRADGRLEHHLRGVFAVLVATIVMVGIAVPAVATFPGRIGRISFFRFLEDKDGPGLSGTEIFSARPDGTDEQQLTFSNDGRSSQLSDWSPDGRRIAFDSDRIDRDGLEDVVQVYVMPWNGETFGLTQLTVGPGFHGDPAWSPSGRHLAIDADWGDYPAQQGIWIIRASDRNGVTREEAKRVTTLPPDAEFDSEPQFSPDGEWIAFTRFKDCAVSCKSAIFRVEADDGSDLQQLTPWDLEASAPDWSPDGRKITFDSCDSGRIGCSGDIYVMRANGKRMVRLTNNPPVTEDRFEFANNPVWSPDGSKILFTQWLDGGFPLALITIDPDGSDPTVIVGGDFFQNKADWGPRPSQRGRDDDDDDDDD